VIRPPLIRTVVTGAIVFGAAIAHAQSGNTGRVEISVGPRWTGGSKLSDGDAKETTPSGSGFRMFTASTTFARATSVDARFGFAVSHRLRALVSGSYGKPTLRISVTNDAENAAPITATERIQQFVVRGGASWALLAASRFAPFVAAEIGYLRELHSGQTLLQTGRVAELGGGATYPLVSRGSGPFRHVGARIDARAVIRSAGAALDGGVRVAPAVGVGLSFGF
jgi:hypothetical protein